MYFQRNDLFLQCVNIDLLTFLNGSVYGSDGHYFCCEII